MSKTTLSYALMQGSEWAIDGCLYCYSSVFLLSCGLSNTQIGFLLGAAIAVSFLGQILLGEYFNRKGQQSVRRFLLVSGVYLIVSSILLLLGAPRALAVPLFMASCLLLQLFPAFMNSAAMYELQCGVPVNYGFGRGCGSLGYAVCTVIIGRFLPWSGTRVMFAGSLLLSVLFLLSVCLFFRQAAALRTEAAPSGMRGKSAHSGPRFSLGFLNQYRSYAVLLLGAVFAMLGHTYMSNFIYQIVSSKGGNEASVGIVSAIAACSEFPVLFFFQRIRGKLREDLWFKLSCLLLTLKMLAAFLASSLLGLTLSELLQAGYALFTVSSVCYTTCVIPKEDTINSQAYLNAASTLGVFLSLVSGGVLIDRFGIPALLLTGTLLLGLGTGIVVLSARPASIR